MWHLRDDPEDTERIRAAQRNMGDYPLKIAKDYRVPEHQRVNNEKKKREKLLLDESFHAIKTVTFFLLYYSFMFLILFFFYSNLINVYCH